MQADTRWYHYLAYFFGGLFLANTVPHLVSGLSGSPFQSPFATPPGKGLSSSTVNVLWGMFNLAVAYLLLARVGRFELRRTSHAIVLGLAVLLTAVACWPMSSGNCMAAISDPGRFSPRTGLSRHEWPDRPGWTLHAGGWRRVTGMFPGAGRR